MNISSLLCSEDPPSERRVIAEPVVLAPHLVRQHQQQHTQSSKLNLEALVHAADQERRRLDSHHSSQSPHDPVSFSYSQRDAEREREPQWEREKEFLEREKEREQVQRDWEREQREREREREQRQFLHQHHQQHQQQHDQNHQDRFFRQREQRQYHRESILGYPSRPESLSPHSHIPLFDQQPTLRASASPKISNLLSSSPHVSRLPLSNSPPYTATDILPQARPLPISSSHPPPYTISIPSDDETDHDRSSKRRRHSDSITQQIHHHAFDVDRLNKERELMTSSGLGYGRGHPSQSIHPDPVKLSISPETVKTSTSSRKPGSSGYSYDPVHDQDTQLPPPPKRPASDIADEKDRERAKNSINFLTGGIQGNPREYHHQPSQQAPSPLTFREHRVVSPAGRRSPPGSHVGRALAARHHDHNHLQDPGLNRVKVERRESALPPTPVPPTAPTPVFLRAQSSEGLEKEREKEKDRVFEKKKGRSRTSNEVVVRQEDLIHKAPKPSATTLSHSHPHSLAQAAPLFTKSRHEDDAHDWFLEQLDDDAVSKRPRSPSRTPSPPPSSVPAETSGKRHSKSPFVQKRTPSPVQDAVMALEQELEDVIDNRKSQQVSNDMDVDQVVTELVEETLGADEEEGKQMEVDVEDELLSLVDDRPTAAVPLSHGTRHTPQTTNEVKGKQTFMKNSTSRPESPSAASPSFRSPSVRATSPRQTSERDSMPPPAVPTVTKESGKQKKNEDRTASDQPKKRGKPGPKPKPRNPDGTIVGATAAAPKPRGKPGPKPKPRDRDGNIIRTPPVAPGNKPSAAATPPVPSRSVSASQQARSRSASALPGGSVGPEESSKHEEVAEDSDAAANDDDKLYCVCKTRYDEDKSMIACDSCDEWYHTNCVDMPDHVVELVDQFACPPCVAKNPSLKLKTTYKPRCLFGLLQPDPDSPKACHKPARTYSKYCSDECGMKNISKRVDMFVRRGGNKSHLWETVKNAEKREGLVRCVEESSDGGKPVIKEVKPKKTAKEKEVDRLNGLLDDIAKVREELKRGMEIIAWREQLIELAAERAKVVKECGWDQRLCFADEEWVEHGELVLESYRDDKMETDAEGEDAVWWCTGEEVCRRHAGWQALRTKDVCKEKEKKADALGKLTSKEREIRKHIENIIDIDDDGAPPAAPLKSSNKQHHGTAGKRKVNGDVAANKKGKKRKAPT